MSNKLKCAVTSCKSEYNKLFRCPQSRYQSNKWKKILRVSENDFYVCEMHFDAQFIRHEKVLIDQAVPTIFMNDRLSQYCACCSSPISQGHQIGHLHIDIHRMLFSHFELNGEFICSNCNYKLIQTSDFIKIVEDSRRHFESIDIDIKEPVIKMEPEEYEIGEEEEYKPYETDAVFVKTENYSGSEQEEEYESESSDKPEPKPKKKRIKIRIRKCDICEYTCSDRAEFVEHLKTIHGADRNPKKPDYDLKLEIDDPHAFVGTKQSKECDICREVFTDRQLLIEHFKAHFDKDRIYVCPYCKKNCKGIVMLGFHKNLDHKVDKYYCICHRTYDREVVMKRCKKVHRKTLVDTKYVCDECDSYVAFGDSLRLGHHKTKIHGNGTKFWCTVCLNPYSKEDFNRCMSKHRIQIATIAIKCPDCDKTMQYLRYKGHQKDRHGETRNEICEVCGLAFPSKPSLSMHKRTKHGASKGNVTYVCDICGNKLNSKGSLLAHIKNRHQNQETFQCPICLKRDIPAHDNHMKKYHPNNHDNGVRVNELTNLYHCPSCVQNFSSLKFYERHVARNNCSVIGECEVDVTKKVGSRTAGRFPCKLCSVVLKSIVRVKVHMNQMHSGELPCPVCKKMYKNRKQLGKHVRSQHNMSMRDFNNA